MSTLRIEQTGDPIDGAFPANLRFDERGYPVTIRHPFDRDDDDRLAWYFEQWLDFPFVGEVRAAEAAVSLRRYGQALFEQLFGDRAAYARYLRLLEGGLRDVTIAISGDPAFTGLLWETLWDPQQAEPLCTRATLLRQNSDPPQVDLTPRPATTLNILLVVARPHFGRDVAYRTISRPLVEAVEQARLPVQIDLVRPGTWDALVRHLEGCPAGHYPIIHFDLHGALLTAEQYRAYRDLTAGAGGGATPAAAAHRYAPFLPRDVGRFAGHQGFLFFAGHEAGRPVPAAADQVADLLQKHGVAICILNACQSAMQGNRGEAEQGCGGEGAAESGSGDSELVPRHPSPVTESSLAARLMDAGVQLALGMRYSVTVTAAARLMPAVYQALLDGAPPAEAVRRGRVELWHDKLRHGGFDQQRPLDDWPLPVLYRNQPVEALPLRPMSLDEANAFYGARAARYHAPALPYGFVGRDVDVLAVEQHLLGQSNSNLLLVRGLGGAGKTALLRHLAQWWSATGLITRAVYFGYDEKPHTRQQVLFAIGEALFGRPYLPLPNEAAERQRLLDKLKSERHLLIFDNLESVTGTDLAIGHALPPAERERLAAFLGELAGGKTLVLLGSRSEEGWLRKDVPALRLYELPGLDAGAAADLAERVLRAGDALHYRSDPAHQPAFDRLMKLLDGHPLAIQAVLGGLAGQTPAEALAALEGGELGELPADELADKSRNVLASVHYAYSNVDPGAAALLACLAPFSGAVNADWLPQYTQRLQAQPALADLPFDRWNEALAAAGRWGLLEPHPLGGGYRRLQPIFPYFLRRRLGQDAARAEAVEAAFVAFYEQLGGELAQLIRSKDAPQRQTGITLTRVEFENLYGALGRALRRRVGFWGMFDALAEYLKVTTDHRARAALCAEVLAARAGYSAEQLAGEFSQDFFGATDRLAASRLQLKDLAGAKEAYESNLELAAISYVEHVRTSGKAGTLHQLGMVAQAQRQWAAAEGYYKQALAIQVEFNDRYSQASTLGQLGLLAEAQEHWATAADYLLQALVIFRDFKDDHSLGMTLRNLARVWQASGDATLPTRVAAALGVPEAQVVALFRQAAGAGPQGDSNPPRPRETG